MNNDPRTPEEIAEVHHYLKAKGFTEKGILYQLEWLTPKQILRGDVQCIVDKQGYACAVDEERTKRGDA